MGLFNDTSIGLDHLKWYDPHPVSGRMMCDVRRQEKEQNNDAN
ncbi:MAG: hypothetical protein ACRBCK_09960 [Alphaproteobacteria bacterium]